MTSGEFTVSSGLLLFFGTCICLAILYIIFVLIQSKRHGGTVSAISVPALFVALSVFSISTPKINGLILKYGENALQISRLNKEIKEKERLLAETPIPAEKEQLTTSAAQVGSGDNTLSEIYSQTKKNESGVYSDQGVLAVTYEKVAKIISRGWNAGKVVSSGVVVFKSEKDSDPVLDSAWVINADGEKVREIEFNKGEKEMIKKALKAGGS